MSTPIPDVDLSRGSCCSVPSTSCLDGYRSRAALVGRHDASWLHLRTICITQARRPERMPRRPRTDTVAITVSPCGPVGAQPAAHLVGMIVRLVGAHEVHAVADGVVLVGGLGFLLGPPVLVHGVDVIGLVVAKSRESRDVKGRHHHVVFVDEVVAVEHVHAGPGGIVGFDSHDLARPKPHHVL